MIPKILATCKPGPARVKARGWEAQSKSPYRWQELNYRRHPRSALGGSWGQDLECKFEHRYSKVRCRRLNCYAKCPLIIRSIKTSAKPTQLCQMIYMLMGLKSHQVHHPGSKNLRGHLKVLSSKAGNCEKNYSVENCCCRWFIPEHS